MYVHACGIRVVSLEHGALGIFKSPVQCSHLKGWTIYYSTIINLSFRSILPSERALRVEPPRSTGIEILRYIFFAERAHSVIPWPLTARSHQLQDVLFFPGLSEFPPETRHILQVETCLLRGVNLSTPTTHLACSPP